MSEWIKCSEALPDKGDIVLCLLNRCRNKENSILRLNGYHIFPQKVLMYSSLNEKYGDTNYYFLDEKLYSYQPTHWKYLGDLPKDEK